MAHYMVRWGFKDSSTKAMTTTPQDRTETARSLVESFGGKLHHYYFSFGDHDGVGICEFPDNVSAAAFSMAATSTGGFSKFETTPLLTGKEAEAAMKKAHGTKTASYRPPNA
jgi:uncharacterized protein with GYD domain